MTLPLALLPYPHIDPVVFHLGPLAVRWYGIAYLLGFVIGYLILRSMIGRGLLRITDAMLGNLMTWVMVGVIGGGRIGWWAFYRPEQTVGPWYEPLAIWHGGMSFHGGLAGVAVALAAWSYVRKASFWNLADCAALVAPVGLFFGRVANFVNAELVGRVTSVPWAMVFPGDTVPRHPSQLYEAVLEGPLLLLLLLWGYRRRSSVRVGQVAALLLVTYGVIRFAVEFTREPDAELGFVALGWITMGQMLSLTTATVGVCLWTWLGRRPVVTAGPTRMGTDSTPELNQRTP